MLLRIPIILYFSSLLPGVAAHPGIVGFVFAVGAPTLVCSVLVVSLFVLVSPVYIDRTRNPRPPDGQQFPPLLQDNRISEDGLESRVENALSVSTNTSTVPIPGTPQIPLSETLQNNGSLIPRSSPTFSRSPSAASKIFSNPLAADASSQTSTSDARTITPSKDSETNKEAADKNNQNSQENLRAVGGPLADADNYSPFNGLRRVISDDIEGPSWRHNNDIDSSRSSASNSSNESPATSIRRTTSYSPSLSSTSSVNEEGRRRIQESYEAHGSIDSVVGLEGVPVDPRLQSTLDELMMRVEGGMPSQGRQ